MAYFSLPFLRKTIVVAAMAGLSFSAHAHHPFLVPTSTIVSGTSPWIMVDAAAAANVFEFDHMALPLDNLQVTAPDGSIVPAENITHSRFRNSFELQLKQQGSYKLDILNQNVFASYKDQGEQKRWRGAAANLSKEIPATATDLQVSERISRVETVVTNGKPGGQSMALSGKGLELDFITHPNDLMAGETARFRFVLDGKPAANIPVELIPGGKRYRQATENQQFVTDSNGIVSITWKNAGLYYLQAEAKDDQHAVQPATSRTVSYNVTLEVLHQ